MPDLRRYEGEKVDILFDAKRCIHAGKCVGGLRSVFNPDGRPWINADEASADEIAEVIHKCPTGALSYERKDGGPAEVAQAEVSLAVDKNGPIFVRGTIDLRDHAGEPIQVGPRAALCRCGASKDKPFCDNSHNDIDFTPDDEA
jgi:uncharacterized Fe-S cluster protein YjdI/CDGSH-type Zn-finger protein